MEKNNNLLTAFADTIENGTEWTITTPKGKVSGIFVDERIPETAIPKGLFKYEFGEDAYGMPSTVEKSVLVNFYGTFITDVQIVFPECGYIVLPSEYAVFSVSDIEWDTVNDFDVDVPKLPKETDVLIMIDVLSVQGEDNMEAVISDKLSDEYGFCVKSFTYIRTK